MNKSIKPMIYIIAKREQQDLFDKHLSALIIPINNQRMGRQVYGAKSFSISSTELP